MLHILITRLVTLCMVMSISTATASSYDEKTVYTQALLSLKYSSEGNTKEKNANGKYAQDSLKSKASGVLFFSREMDWCDSASAKKFGIIQTLPKAEKWIALIPKKQSKVDNCSLSTKIETATKLNSSGVIFYNDVPGEVPVIEKKSTSIIITVIIDEVFGKELIDLYESVSESNGKRIDCVITVGTHYVDRRWKVSRTSVLFVLVSFILLMCISLAWLVFYYVQRFRHIYINDRREKQLLSAAKKAISKLKTRGYQEAQREDLDESCAVCLECYKESETLRILPCKHEFHKACIDPWLVNHRTCPMCKSNILKSLGVDIPEPINDVTRETHRVNSILSPGLFDTADGGRVEITTRQVPQSSAVVVVVHDHVQQAWPEPSATLPSASTSAITPSSSLGEGGGYINENTNRYSAGSNNSSDTDSDRSTVALVSFERRV